MKGNAADWSRHELITVFDGTRLEHDTIFPPRTTDEGELCTEIQRGVGAAKNLGATWYARTSPLPDDLLMFSDNDMYYLPDWDIRLEKAMVSRVPTQLGGWKHPFHGTGSFVWCETGAIRDVDAVTGNCFVIRWADWVKYGPFDENAIGPGQSEDYALSQRIKSDGHIVATLDPPIAIHVGLSNCLGEPATGWQEMSSMAEKQIKENKIDKIWLATPDEGTILLERQSKAVFSGLNVGSGQRRFDTNCGWINVDCVSRSNQVPDVVCDAVRLVEQFGKETQDMVVLHHVLEHFGCGEADDVIRQCYEVLKPGGSLLVFVPDMSRLAGRWLGGEISDYIFFVNAYGAYQGEDGDRHKWGYSRGGLYTYLDNLLYTQALEAGNEFGPTITGFDWREIPGADMAKDWWVLGMEVIK